MDESITALLKAAVIRESRGHTRVLCAAIAGDRIRIALLGKSTSLGAGTHIDGLLRTTTAGQLVAFATMNKDGEIRAWHGRSVLHPDPEEKPGYYPNWYLPDLVREVEVARRIGTLKLDPLLAGAVVVDGTLPLRVASAPRGDRLDRVFAAIEPTRSMLDFPDTPHGLVRMVHLLPREGRVRAIDDILGRKPRAQTNSFSDKHQAWLHSEARSRYSSALRGLLAPAPQELPARMLEGSSFVRAWLLAHKGHRDYDTPTAGQYVTLVALTVQGVLHVRRFVDTFDLALLPLALKHAEIDRCALRDNQLDELSLLVRLKEANDDRDSFVSGYFIDRDASTALSRFARKEADCVRALGESIYETLAPELRDEFVDVEDYNLLHAAGDTEKASARKQAARSVWGGMSLLLSDTAAGKVLLDKVDARFKLHAAAAKVLGVRRWVVRRLTTTGPAVLDALADGFMGGRYLPQFIQWLGPNVKVRSVFDVNKLKEMYRFLVVRNRSWRGQTSYKVRFRAELIGRTVETLGFDEAVRVVRGAIASGLDAEEVQDYFEFVDDCLQAAFDERVKHLNLDSWDTRLLKARLALYAGSNLEDVVRWASRYHDIIVRLPVAAPQSPTANSKPIPTLLTTTELPRSGWQVEQLTSYEALRREGTEMEHCVRTYHGKVAAMTSAIFALRGPQEMDRVTVEVDRGGISGWRMLQARGFRNATIVPGSDGHIALDEFLETLERATATADADLVAAYKKSRRTSEDGRDKPFIEELLESYGSRGWEMIKNTMPGSAHGRMESKLWDAMVTGNPDTPKRVYEHDRCWDDIDRRAVLSAMASHL